MGRMNAVLAAMAVMVIAGAPSSEAQTAAELQTLRSQIEDRFDVLPVRDGVLLSPKDDSRGVRSIQLTGGAIAIDGEPVTGAELRQRLDADADLVLRLSYLDAPAQRALFGPRGPQHRQSLPSFPRQRRRSHRRQIQRPRRNRVDGGAGHAVLIASGSAAECE